MNKRLLKLFATLTFTTSAFAIQFTNNTNITISIATQAPGAGEGAAESMNEEGYMGVEILPEQTLEVSPYVNPENQITFWVQIYGLNGPTETYLISDEYAKYSLEQFVDGTILFYPDETSTDKQPLVEENIDTDLVQDRKRSASVQLTPNKKLTNYPCGIGDCQYQPENQSNLKRHQESVHYGIKYPCLIDSCEYKATRKDDLKRHRKKQHPEHFKN